MTVKALRPHCHNSGMMPFWAERRNPTGSFVWILSALRPPTFISTEALKDRWPPYRFPRHIFSANTRSLPLCRPPSSLSSQQSLFSHLAPSHFCALTLFSSLPVSISQAGHVRLLSVRLPISGQEGREALSDPVCFHFPRFLWGTDSIAACCCCCCWGWHWHLKVALPLDACLLSSSGIPFLYPLWHPMQFPSPHTLKKHLSCMIGDGFSYVQRPMTVVRL